MKKVQKAAGILKGMKVILEERLEFDNQIRDLVGRECPISLPPIARSAASAERFIHSPTSGS